MEVLMEHAQISFLRRVCSSVSGLPPKRVSRAHTSRSTSVARSSVSSTPESGEEDERGALSVMGVPGSAACSGGAYCL